MGQVFSCTPGQLRGWRKGALLRSGVEGFFGDFDGSFLLTPAELLGSTKRFNVNYQDADG